MDENVREGGRKLTEGWRRKGIERDDKVNTRE